VVKRSCQLLVASCQEAIGVSLLATNHWQLATMSDGNEIILALEEQVGCYRKLTRLAEAQREHVQRSNMEALLEVLKNRQEILDQLGKLEGIIKPAKARWAEFLGEIDGETRARAEEMVTETRQLLEQIMASDRTDALALQQRKLNVGRQINKASGARQINRTYANAAYGQRRPRMDIQQ
jgi:FlgN protein